MPAIDSEEAGPFPDTDGPADRTLSGPIIGIIYPPPEVRSILNLKECFIFVRIEQENCVNNK